jgi:hypothetical protein
MESNNDMFYDATPHVGHQGRRMTKKQNLQKVLHKSKVNWTKVIGPYNPLFNLGDYKSLYDQKLSAAHKVGNTKTEADLRVAWKKLRANRMVDRKTMAARIQAVTDPKRKAELLKRFQSRDVNFLRTKAPNVYGRIPTPMVFTKKSVRELVNIWYDSTDRILSSKALGRGGGVTNMLQAIFQQFVQYRAEQFVLGDTLSDETVGQISFSVFGAVKSAVGAVCRTYGLGGVLTQAVSSYAASYSKKSFSSGKVHFVESTSSLAKELAKHLLGLSAAASKWLLYLNELATRSKLIRKGKTYCVNLSIDYIVTQFASSMLEKYLKIKIDSKNLGKFIHDHLETIMKFVALKPDSIKPLFLDAVGILDEKSLQAVAKKLTRQSIGSSALRDVLSFQRTKERWQAKQKRKDESRTKSEVVQRRKERRQAVEAILKTYYKRDGRNVQALAEMASKDPNFIATITALGMSSGPLAGMTSNTVRENLNILSGRWKVDKESQTARHQKSEAMRAEANALTSWMNNRWHGSSSSSSYSRPSSSRNTHRSTPSESVGSVW